jgi:hypothetical protein
MERGQAHTLEGVVAGLLLLASIIFALQMTAVTPLSASTSSQHIENQQRSVASGVLATAAERDGLAEMVLYWNESRGKFHNTSDNGYYTADPPNTTLGAMLNRSFDREGISYNVYVHFQSPSGKTIQNRVVYRGVPSDNAVSASRAVTLDDDDRLYDYDLRRTNVTVNESSSFYAQDVGPGTYNVVRVEVVAWRI